MIITNDPKKARALGLIARHGWTIPRSPHAKSDEPLVVCLGAQRSVDQLVQMLMTVEANAIGPRELLRSGRWKATPAALTLRGQRWVKVTIPEADLPLFTTAMSSVQDQLKRRREAGEGNLPEIVCWHLRSLQD